MGAFPGPLGRGCCEKCGVLSDADFSFQMSVIDGSINKRNFDCTHVPPTLNKGRHISWKSVLL